MYCFRNLLSYSKLMINSEVHKRILTCLATKWMTLTSYIKYLGTSGLAKVEPVDNPDGSEFPPLLFISYIDTSVNLQSQQAVKRKMVEKSEEDRDRKLLEEQIKSANVGSSTVSSEVPTELVRPEGKIVFGGLSKGFGVAKKTLLKPMKMSKLVKKD